MVVELFVYVCILEKRKVFFGKLKNKFLNNRVMDECKKMKCFFLMTQICKKF